MLSILLPPLLIVFALCSLNWFRSRQRVGIALSPNFLITRYPILFIEGKKSIFYFGSYWNYIPTLLYEHGYDCTSLPMPWSNPRKRQERVLKFLGSLQEKNQKVHIVGDPSTIDELKTLRAKGGSLIESAWMVTSDNYSQDHKEDGIDLLKIPPQKNSILLHWRGLWWLHQLFTTGKLHFKNHSHLGIDTYIPQSKVDKSYLNWAIQLAESDYKSGLRILSK